MSHQIASFEDLEDAFYENVLVPTVRQWTGEEKSMAGYEGKITKVFERNGRWSLLMNDEEWYSLGRKQPKNGQGEPVTDGDFAKFTYEMNGKYRNVDEGSLRTKAGEAPPKTGGGGRRSGGGGGGGKDNYWKEREMRDIENQKRISFAGSLNTANAIVTSAIQLEFLKLPGGKKASYEAYTAAVMAEAEEIYRVIQTTNDRHDQLMSGPITKQDKLPDDMKAEDPKGDDTPFEDGGSDDDWS